MLNLFENRRAVSNLVTLVVILACCLSLGNNGKTLAQSSGGVPVPSGSSTSSPASTSQIFSTPSPGNDDDANGDDGSAIKKDMKEVEHSEGKNSSLLDNHQFYKPEYITDPDRALSYWVDFSKLQLSQNASTKHAMLSNSHRRAAPIKLSFEFPFYGHPLKNIIIATGGFLYVGEHLHHWLAATQNISPLMANFDLSAKNYSDIHYHDNGTALTVQWLDVQMKDDKPPGNFSFQATLHKNGDIVFVYKSLPAKITDIPEDEHPVKVGISDAFLIDKVAFFIRRKTIYDYHRLNLKESEGIGNKTAIYLKALPTCNQYDYCDTCAKAPPNLECVWCPAVKRCSNGFDRKRQEWLTNHCDKVLKSDCSAKAAADASGSSASSSSSSSGSGSSSSGSGSSANQINPGDLPNASRRTVPMDKSLPDPRSSEGSAAFASFLMFVALSSGVALWAFYAYKNPHTPSGQLLIKYRPGNWRWQNAETRYTAASIHM